ncbi:hypothetical protein LOZ52_005986 [Ophidiomyces ophidiicola]|nr:hypothetical protein LOZ64_004588 [Ophidiomyces ophidiicola]KAI2013897.1 hypothetical protein LOZ49_001698 [Ophidiomyces ophidiicola]KAI2018690.1 hypothetical protein LOZ46_003738 [Ophidiomyces ophidiicola]KAI2133343.1 hypothetical protein LOZ29_004725 [Ophidiomyces ophidiicola]KAI2146907.1 hypothetical protein LOZ28_000412 [Ophidiomyces ophidiicola]
MTKSNVNRPMNAEFREKDINKKLQLYGIYSAFKNGKVPSNKQIDIALNSALESKALATPSDKLSEEGRVIVRDIRDVITHTRNLALVKNEGNLLQEFIWDAERFKRPEIATPEKPFDKEGAKQHGQQVTEGLKTLGTLLVTNGEFRKLLNDATLLIRDMASDSAQKAANFIRPPADQLSQIDQPAAENVWHERPDMSKDGLKARWKQRTQKDKESGGVEPQNGAANGDMTAEVKEEANKRRREMTEKTKEFLATKMPQERREQTVWRMKKMIVEIQGHSDYQQAIETLLSLAETYTGHTKDLSKQGLGNLKGARNESSDLKRLEANLKVLIERFANSTSLDDLFDSINKFYRNAEKDPRLREWFQAVNFFIRRCLQEQGFVLQEASNEEWRRLYDEGQYLFRDRYRDDSNRLVGEVKFMGEQFDQDPLNKQFSTSMQKLFTDLGTDREGKVVFKKNLLNDFATVVVPGFFENLHYIPIPRIEVSDPMIDVIVENLAIESDNLMPNIVEFGSDNYWRWGRKKFTNKHDNKMLISATGIQADLRDVSYYIKKKQGFPKISDTGVMDIYLGGEGFSCKIIGSTCQPNDKQHFFKADKVQVAIKNLDIRLKQSKHKLLFSIFRPLLFSLVRPAIQKALEKQIRDSFTKADAFAYDIHKEANRTREAARADPEDKSSMYSHYIEAGKKKMAEKKEVAEKQAQAKSKRDTKVNMAVTQHDSIFQAVKLPGGISSKATEYKELAAKGDRWESPVFGIGKASQTSNLPKLAPITRKPHQIVVKPREQETADRATAQRVAPAQYGEPRAAPMPIAQGEPIGFASQPPTTYPPGPVSYPGQAAPVGVTTGATVIDDAARGAYSAGAQGAAAATGAAGTAGTTFSNGLQTIPGTKAPVL